MAAPYNPNQQPNQPLGHSANPPQVAYGYPPQDQGTSAQYPPPPVQAYPPQGYPPLTDLPPAYPTQGPPPAYVDVYKQDQPAYNYQPQLANTTVVVAAQPMTATTTRVSPPGEDHSGMAVCALVLSLCTLSLCGASVICLAFSIPALILSVVALWTRGKSQKNNACVSIGLNVAVVVCTVVLIVAVVTPVTVTAGSRYCPSYYSSSYSTYCRPYSYTTSGSCSYYYTSSTRGYCPSTSTYRYCAPYYSSTYSTYCRTYSSSTTGSCRYYSYSGYCPTTYRYRYCPSYYSSFYSTRCVPSRYSTSGSCSYSGTANRDCPT